MGRLRVVKGSEESTAYLEHQKHCQIKDVFIRKDTQSELSARYFQEKNVSAQRLMKLLKEVT